MTPSGEESPVMADCAGLWRRTLLIDADGNRDTDTDVLWLQGISVYVDSRGFAGRLSQRGPVFEWHRLVDLQPPTRFPDAGRMCWEGTSLVETGVHVDYVEHWDRDRVDTSPCWGLTLRGPMGDEALLVRVGTSYGWADSSEVRIGTVDGPDWAALDPSLATRELRAHGGRWRISTIEGRVDL